MRIEPEVDAARRRLGIPDATPLGAGGEAVVYPLDRDRVARIHRPGAWRRGPILARAALLGELAPQQDRVPFQLPSVLETRTVGGCIVCIEPRLEGQALMSVLEHETGPRRESLVRACLEAAAAIGALDVPRPDCRDLCRTDAVRGATPREWARARASAALEAAGPDFDRLDGAALADAVFDALAGDRAPALVHMDAFAGNMLALGTRITAVIDFGTVSARADPRLDPLLAAVYFQDPMTPPARPGDREVVHAWLREHGLAEACPAAERWAAAFWSPAADDVTLHAWCRRVLLGGA